MIGKFVLIGSGIYFLLKGGSMPKLEVTDNLLKAIDIIVSILKNRPDPMVFARIVYYAYKYDIPISIAIAMVNQESAFKPNAFRAEPGSYDSTVKRIPRFSVYPKEKWGSYGLTQVMVGTAVDMGHSFGVEHLDKLYDQDVNLKLGFRYLKKMYKKFGDWKKALQAYNAGPGSVINNWEAGKNYAASVTAKAEKLKSTNIDILV